MSSATCTEEAGNGLSKLETILQNARDKTKIQK